MGMTNPMTQRPMQPGAANPLVPTPQQAPGGAPQNMAQRIAGMGMSPQKLAEAAGRAAYSAQALGALARKPDVSTKDVINSTGQAVADGKITAADAVKFLATMPQDDQQLRPWLDQLYMHNLAGAVHMRAMMAGAPVPQAAAPQIPPMQQAGITPNA